MLQRLERRSCCSMPQKQNTLLHWHGPSRSKKNVNLRNYGTKQHKPSRNVTTRPQPTRKRKSKTCKEMKLLGELKTVLNGARDFSDQLKEDLADQMKARKIWIGF